MTIFKGIKAYLYYTESGVIVRRSFVLSHLRALRVRGTITRFSDSYVDKVLRMFRATGYLMNTSVRGVYIRGTKSVEGLTLSELENKYREAIK